MELACELLVYLLLYDALTTLAFQRKGREKGEEKDGPILRKTERKTLLLSKALGIYSILNMRL